MRLPAGRLLLATAALLAAATAAAAQGGPPKAHPRLSDIPYIQCQVCELLAKNAWKSVKELAKSATPTNKLDEMKIIEHMEKITTAWRLEGEWIAKIDLVEQGDRLVAKEMDQLGNCGVECKTVERAAEDIMGEHDTDVAEVLFTGKKNRAQFTNWLCYELSGVCKTKPPPLPKDRQPGPAFDPQKEGDANLERMMGQMQDSGMKGKLWSREDLMAKYGMPEGHPKGEDDEDDDLEEEEVPAGPAPVPPAVRSVQRLAAQAKGAAQGAAQAAGKGVRAAAERARGLWDAFQARQKGQGQKEQEL